MMIKSASNLPLNAPPLSSSEMEGWGYYLLPPEHPDSPGASGLVVAIRAKPTGRHFDPETMTLRMPGMNGQPERWTLERKPPQLYSARVCWGDVSLVDRVAKSVEFFTFGGTLEIQTDKRETIYTLLSPAPILMLLSDIASLQDQFVAEVEREFNALRAVCGLSESEFERRVAALAAQTLYEATMRALWKNYELSGVMQKTFPEFFHMLTHEVNQLKEHTAWWETGPTLAELVAAPSK